MRLLTHRQLNRLVSVPDPSIPAPIPPWRRRARSGVTLIVGFMFLFARCHTGSRPHAGPAAVMDSSSERNRSARRTATPQRKAPVRKGGSREVLRRLEVCCP